MKGLHFIRCAVLLLCSLLPLQAQAVGGISSDQTAPHFASGKFNQTFTDLEVKVLGGYVRITRYWEDGHWVWNRRWNDLEPVWANVDDTHPSAFRRIDQHYPRVQGGNVRYENQLIYTIEYDEAQDEYRWQDRQGNRIDYAVQRDDNGRVLRVPMVRYQDRNGINVSVERDAEGYITAINDHFGNPVITYSWEAASASAEQRLAGIEDHTGRQVQYLYDSSDRLTSVVDVRGETYTYSYSNDGQLSRFTDPKGQATTYSFSPIEEVILAQAESDGEICEYKQIRGTELKSVYNADGVGQRYSVSYNQDSGEFTRRTTDATGVENEYRFNEHGELIAKSIDGRLQFSDQVLLSDGSISVDNLIGHYRSGYGIAAVRSLVDGVPQTNCMLIDTRGDISQLGRQTLVYVKQRTRTDSLGRKTVTEYDQFKNPVKVTYADGSTLTRSYNRYNQVLRQTDPRGVITTFDYDDSGNLLTLTEAVGTAEQRITRLEYDQYGQPIRQTTGESAAGLTALAVTQWEYDDYGNLIQATDPLTHTTRYQQYDGLGNPALIIDEADHQWTLGFDAAGSLLHYTDPLGQAEVFEYDAAGDLVQVTAPNQATTVLTNNAAGLPLSVTDDAQHTSRLEYDKAYRPTAMIDANGHGQYLDYDTEGRLTGLTDGLENQTGFSYEEDQLRLIHYPTYSEEFDYDRQDRLRASTQQAENLNRLRQFGYDPNGNPVQSTDANNLSSQREYDALNRITRFTDASGGVTQLAYDARDNLLQVTDPEGRITQYSYSLRDELISETKQGDSSTARSYEYDQRGNPVRATTPAGEETRYSYDDANRRTEQRVYAQASDSDPVKVVVYHYNELAQYTGYSQTHGSATSGQTADIRALSETYSYNSLNQLVGVTVDFGPFQKSYSYTYYPNGLKQSYTNPEGLTYTYHYNANNQIEAVVIPGVGQLAYSDFNWNQPQTLTLPGGNTIRYRYDPLQQPLERNLYDAADSLLAQAIYAYDNESNITGIQTEHGDYTFSYDSLYRLTNGDYPAESALPQSEAFSYDGVGNRTQHDRTQADQAESSVSASYNARNQLTGTDHGWSYSYNANGHTTQKTYTGSEPADGPQSVEYVYNHEERLIAVSQDGATAAEYAYDPYGRRILKTDSNDSATYFLYTDQGLTAEYDASGTLIKEYHFRPGAPWSTDPLFQRTADNRIYYYQNDHLGTPQRMVAASGNIVWEARYEAFGLAVILTESVENNLRFPGQYFDSETGLHYNYFRDYDPRSGRYIQSDLIGLAGGLNAFLYVDGNPFLYVDPFGLSKISGCKILEYLDTRTYNWIKEENKSARTESRYTFMLAALEPSLDPLSAINGRLKTVVSLRFGLYKEIRTTITWENWNIFGSISDIRYICTYTEKDSCGNEIEKANFVTEYGVEKLNRKFISNGKSVEMNYIPTPAGFSI